MQQLVLSGQIIDLILSLVAVEIVVLGILQARRRVGPGWRAMLPNLIAGATLLLAVRAAITGSAWPSIAAWLAAAGVAHVADLWTRWDRKAH
ncbi:MAG TPA: hypothetical protein VMK32_00455 [Burkholderiaceae bacterium]|nr:hypothetical protein [Burkholderiaceae bacterium]